MVEMEQIQLKASGLQFTAFQAGAAEDPVVLCLHGFPDSPTTCYRLQVEPLVAAGYRVIVPTLRGYEPSSQPEDGDYSLLTIADDVVGWLDDLGVQKAHAIGHDWGAVILYVVAARCPDRLWSAASLGIPPLARIPQAVRKVPYQLLRSWYMTFFQLPVLSDTAMAANDWALLRRLWKTWSPSYALADREWQQIRAQFAQPGVPRAALAYYRQNATPPLLLGLTSNAAMELFEIPATPMLILHGTQDGCMDARLFPHAVQASDFPAGVDCIPIDGAGHFLHVECPERVNAALLQHIRQHAQHKTG